MKRTTVWQIGIFALAVTATVAGVQYKNDQGSVTVGLTARKGKTGWLITDMSIEGL